jgi:hypothetical protein
MSPSSSKQNPLVPSQEVRKKLEILRNRIEGASMETTIEIGNSVRAIRKVRIYENCLQFERNFKPFW